MSITVVDHALPGHLLAQLRDQATPPPVFRTLASASPSRSRSEAIRDLPTTEIPVQTPLERTTAGSATSWRCRSSRARLGMLEAVTDLFPEVAVGYIGLERDEALLQPQSYYRKLPECSRPPRPGARPHARDRRLEPAATAAVREGDSLDPIRLRGRGARGHRNGMESDHPDVPIFTADRPAAERPGLHHAGPRRLRRPAVRDVARATSLLALVGLAGRRGRAHPAHEPGDRHDRDGAIIRMNCGRSADDRRVVEPQRIATANPNSQAKNISRIGFQFDRINAARAMNPRPGAVPSRQLPTTSAARNAPDAPANAPEQHSLVPVDRDADAERARGLGVLAARAQAEAPPGPVPASTTPGSP